MRSYKKLLILVALLSCVNVAWGKTDEQSVTFVQITDAHLFDSGKRENAEIERIDTRLAWDWALLQINRLVVSGKEVNFVVFTGDFGLEQVCLNHDFDKPSCIPSELAVQTVAQDLSNLLVKKIYLVRGNNDLSKENPDDAARFDCFVQLLKVNLKDKDIVNLTPGATTSELAYVDLSWVRIVGLDSSSFKNDAEEKTKESNNCIPKGGEQEWDKILSMRKTKQEDELRRVKRVLIETRPSILFTHAPNLDDPYRVENCDKRFGSWNLSPHAWEIWSEIVSNKNLKAIFAGHFHDPNPWKYLHPYSWEKSSGRDPRVEGVTYLTPPLAAKFQINKSPQARGLRVATVTQEGKVNSEIQWFNTAWTFSFLAPPDTIKAQTERSNNLDCKCLYLISMVSAVFLLCFVILYMVLNKIIDMKVAMNTRLTDTPIKNQQQREQPRDQSPTSETPDT